MKAYREEAAAVTDTKADSDADAKQAERIRQWKLDVLHNRIQGLPPPPAPWKTDKKPSPVKEGTHHQARDRMVARSRKAGRK